MQKIILSLLFTASLFAGTEYEIVDFQNIISSEQCLGLKKDAERNQDKAIESYSKTYGGSKEDYDRYMKLSKRYLLQHKRCMEHGEEQRISNTPMMFKSFK